MYMVFGAVLVTLLMTQPAFAKEEASNRASADARAKTPLSVVAKLFLLGAGAEFEMRWNPSNAVGLGFDAESSLVDSASTAFAHYRRYWGNSFFTKIEAGAANYSEFDDQGWQASAGVVVGNEWQYDSGLTLGADWFGVFASPRIGDSPSEHAWHWPKVRVGYAF